jgi:predicted amidohydrolase YtcJ
MQAFSGRIANCYDSHVHWQATGTFNNRVQLHSLSSLANLEADLRRLEIPETAMADQWICGFGWDQNAFAEDDAAAHLNHEILDRVFGERPVFFERVDGHAVWVNQSALQQAGLWRAHPACPPGGEIQLKADGFPSGILLDHAMQMIWKLLPPRTTRQIRHDLLTGQDTFLDAGFTHIRDLSGDEAQWQVTSQLAESGDLRLAVEQFFGAEDPNLFDGQLDLAVRLRRNGVAPGSLIRPMGVKIFLDGALGSEGALLSCEYCGRPGRRGLQLLDVSTLRDFIRRTWEAGLPIAVHAIGDAAAHLLAGTACHVAGSGVKGELHIEHAELMRVDTIALLKNLPSVTCYMQPSHWLTDRRWLKAKIGHLSRRAFRWADLEASNISVMFGSDSPIEKPSLASTFAAVHDLAANDHPLPRNPIEYYHSHKDVEWTPHTETLFSDGQVQLVQFLGRTLRSSGKS